ncbi:hypothetical protein DRO61_04650 [Candidatus Bathyarchaeota archaeon]|nr:MAG: hypothetical protein DRO61_04650 [Candidatus Bathyarchaeota archaeon]
MSKHRQAARIDANEKEIVKALRKIPNVTVQQGHDDLLCGYKGVTYWFEIKDPDKVFNKDGGFKKGAIKPSQEKLLENWTGHYQIVWELDQILKAMGICGT